MISMKRGVVFFLAIAAAQLTVATAARAQDEGEDGILITPMNDCERARAACDLHTSADGQIIGADEYGQCLAQAANSEACRSQPATTRSRATRRSRAKARHSASTRSLAHRPSADIGPVRPMGAQTIAELDRACGTFQNYYDHASEEYRGQPTGNDISAFEAILGHSIRLEHPAPDRVRVPPAVASDMLRRCDEHVLPRSPAGSDGSSAAEGSDALGASGAVESSRVRLGH